MKKPIYFIIALIPFLFSSFVNSQSTVSIRLGPSSGQDCLVLSNFPNTAFPEHSDLAGLAGTVQGIYYAGRSYFRFDLSEIPSDSNVIDARLSLFANPNPSNNTHDGLNRSYIRRVTTPWIDADVTFDNQPDFTHANEVVLEQSNSPYEDYTNIDVTEIVRQMVSEPENNHGFMLALRLEGIYRSMNFASGECPDISKRPLLVVTYGTISGIQNISSGIPAEFNLYQNFPNPFNPVTSIKFDVAGAAITKIGVYDELGKEVSVLVNESLNPGSYQVQWDGSRFSSGAYYIRMESDNVLITKKIVLLK
ncbi:MAG TPA: DNRLRE domain-containing protein [Ignavibacteria bacterium]|nr:DNRLRE domain-containing protein [Ignavibacteria bacterium]